jgi:glycosyltransferase involved in cell wall biosynthesis
MRNFLRSCQQSEYRDFEVVVNDDQRSTDGLESVVAQFATDGLRVRYLRKNLSMAQGRKSAVEYSGGSILMHLDSDMEITSGLIGECVVRIQAGGDALVVPEESFGSTFWARCKWLEKRCYDGVDQIESLRVLTRDCYDAVGGHSESMVFSEDKDLDLRVRAAGYHVSRTRSQLRHNEGRLTLRGTLAKKHGYSTSADIFAQTHPEHYRWQTNIFHRYRLYLRNIGFLSSHPAVYCGLLFMKTLEFGAGALGWATNSLRARRAER